MWRNVITTFGRSLVITRRHLGASNYLKWNGHLGNVAFNNGTRSLCSITLLRNNDEATSESVTDFRTDADYITPYRVEHEQRVSTQFFLDTLHSRFRLSHTEVEQILNDEAVSKCEKRRSMASTLDFMIMEGVTKKSFVANPWMLTLDERSVVKKVNVLKTIKHMRDINDFVPLLRVKAPRLRKVVLDLNRESKYIENGNRIYYIAAKLDVPAALITKYLSKRLFVLQMPYDMFNSNLQHMINYKVDPMSLLKDLWAFRYTPRVVEIRLRRAQQAKKDKLMPWMVRCPESILQK